MYGEPYWEFVCDVGPQGCTVRFGFAVKPDRKDRDVQRVNPCTAYILHVLVCRLNKAKVN